MSTRRFDEYYRAFPVAMMNGVGKEQYNYGGKCFLPASALERLSRLHVTWPIIFELINGAESKTSHAGVLEFTAEEGKIYMPYWVFANQKIQNVMSDH